ncbi:MAG: NAD(P)/FAD-dependent oxidoreductase [Lautropia sp.]
MSETIAVIGAGQAGGWAARSLRDLGYSGRVVLVGDEPHPPYERPPLSKGILGGSMAAQAATIFDAEALGRLEIDWRPAVTCASIDRAGRAVTLSDGTSIRYDQLILCTGGRARRLEIPGADLSNVFTLRNLDDTAALAARLEPGRHLVAIGGGWIGLEVAATARGKGLEATVVEAEARLCARTLPPEGSEFLHALHQRHGARLLLGRTVERIDRMPDGRLAVMLGGGQILPADLVVVGVGLVPNDELARESGLECRGGIVVDTRCRTSDDRILAAGDVAVTFNTWYQQQLRLESWQNAQDQGIAAAKSALGQDIRYDPLPRFWSDQYDVTVQILGCVGGGRGVPVVRRDQESDRFMIFNVDGNRLLGVLGVNAAADLRAARRLLVAGKPVQADALSDPAFDLAEAA